MAFLNTGNSDFNATTGDVNFKVTPEFEITYLQPLTFTGYPLSISGFANIVMPKGKDGFNTNSRTEILTAERLTLDLGQVAFNKPKLLDLFVGYKYWMNKFGSNGSCSGVCATSFSPGAFESQVFGRSRLACLLIHSSPECDQEVRRLRAPHFFVPAAPNIDGRRQAQDAVYYRSSQDAEISASRRSRAIDVISVRARASSVCGSLPSRSAKPARIAALSLRANRHHEGKPRISRDRRC